MAAAYREIPERILLAGLTEGEAKVRRRRAVQACISGKSPPWRWLRMRIVAEWTSWGPKVQQPEEVAALIDAAYPEFARSMQEIIVVVPCDTRLKALGVVVAHVGARNLSMVNPPEVLRPVVLAAPATRFFLAHNHPSGDPSPSQDDRDTWVRMQEAAKQVGVKADDFLVVTPNEVHSIAMGTTRGWQPGSVDLDGCC